MNMNSKGAVFAAVVLAIGGGRTPHAAGDSSLFHGQGARSLPPCWSWGDPGPPPLVVGAARLDDLLRLRGGYDGIGFHLAFTFEQWLALNGVTDAQEQAMLARLYRWWLEHAER